MEPEPYDILITGAAEDDLLRMVPRLRVMAERTISRLTEYAGPDATPSWLHSLRGRTDSYRMDFFDYYVLVSIDEVARVIRVARVVRRSWLEAGGSGV